MLRPGRAEGLDRGPLAYRSLEVQLEAAAGGRPDGLLGGVVEAVAPQPATGRGKREGARTSRHPPVGQRGRTVLERHLRTEEGGEIHGSMTLCMGGWFRWQGSILEPLEGGVALEGLGERHATLGAELVVLEPAHTAKEG